MKQVTMKRVVPHPKYMMRNTPWQVTGWAYEGTGIFEGHTLAIVHPVEYASDSELIEMPDKWMLCEYTTGQLLCSTPFSRRAKAPTPSIRKELEKQAVAYIQRVYKRADLGLSLEDFVTEHIWEAVKINE